jgi:hypothetical protein
VPPTKTVVGTPTRDVSTARPVSAGIVNPLTGEPTANPDLLRVPAVLVSISHFPAFARPQAGLSFAPYVYEFYITEGATRYLAVFYGEFPSIQLPVEAGCKERSRPLRSTKATLGNLVWLDSNRDGKQDPGERGIGGLCVNLLDESGHVVASTSTDSNGYYGFDIAPGRYVLQFKAPPYLAFTAQHASGTDLDSDADTQSGEARVDLHGDDLTMDAGLVTMPGVAVPTGTSTADPLPRVGPIRSGRLIYHYIANYFESSCLIFGSASPEVLVHLPQCLTVFHQISGGGFMLNIDQMISVARENQKKHRTRFDYSGNLFSMTRPTGGQAATDLHEYWAYQNQSAWTYDAASESYWRYVDTSEYDEAGILHREVDRLTHRQLKVENVIVLFAKHEVISPTNLDIHLDPGRSGNALLMRDGQLFDITWATTSRKEMDTSALRPIRFLTPDGNPATLKPGHTWIIVVTPETTVEDKGGGRWQMTFAQPAGAK